MNNFDFYKNELNFDEITPHDLSKELIIVQKAPFYDTKSNLDYYYPVLITSDGMIFSNHYYRTLVEGYDEQGFPTPLTAAINHEMEWLMQPHYNPDELIKCCNCKYYSENYLGWQGHPGCPYEDDCFGKCDFASRVNKSVPYEEHKFYCEKEQKTPKKVRKTKKKTVKMCENDEFDR